ncbi:MAG: hypothetical protein GY842_06470 [bacterium]|nr:hypothetical protein [bacterium]
MTARYAGSYVNPPLRLEARAIRMGAAVALLFALMLSAPGCESDEEVPSPLTREQMRELVTNDIRAACPTLAEAEIVDQLVAWQFRNDGVLPREELLETRLRVCESGGGNPTCPADTEDMVECMVDCAWCNDVLIDTVHLGVFPSDVDDACYFASDAEIETLMTVAQGDWVAGVSRRDAIADAVDSCLLEPGDTGEYPFCGACRITIIDFVYP